MRIVALTLLLAACSRAPDRITTVEEWERDSIATTTEPPKIEQSVVIKRPFPCCDPTQPVGDFDP